MTRKRDKAGAYTAMGYLLVILNVIIVRTAYLQNHNWYWALGITLPLLLVMVFYKSKWHSPLHYKAMAEGAAREASATKEKNYQQQHIIKNNIESQLN